MLKREITYEDFNGNQVTETCYFHLSKPELIDMELEEEGGMTGIIQKIVADKENRKIVGLFKEIVLNSYGQKSEDGRSFMKSPEMRQQFAFSAAFEKLFMDVFTDDIAAANFIKGVLPADLVQAIEGQKDQDKPTSLPTLPPKNEDNVSSTPTNG